MQKVSSPGRSLFRQISCCGGAIRARSTGRKVVTFQEDFIPTHISSCAEGTCLMKPRSSDTHPVATLPSVRQPSPEHRLSTETLHLPEGCQPQGIFEKLFQRAEEREGNSARREMKEETLELFHRASSTSITRWECCTPGEPFAQLRHHCGEQPRVYSSFSSPSSTARNKCMRIILPCQEEGERTQQAHMAHE